MDDSNYIPTCCGLCYDGFPSGRPVFPRHIPLPENALDWAGGILVQTETVAFG